MPKKKEDKVTIDFLGNNSEDVTGSCTLVNFGKESKRKILFECGLIQGEGNILDDYRANNRMLQKVRSHKEDIEYIICGHIHVDHIGNIPNILKSNKNIKIIIPNKSKGLLLKMLLDSARISARNCEQISSDVHIYEPFYTEEDVYSIMDNIVEVRAKELYEIDEELSIRFIPSGHILNAMQCEMFIKLSNHTTKILWTSDLGNLVNQEQKFYLDKFEPVQKSNIVIGECTYGEDDLSKSVTKKNLEKDMEKMKSVIDQFTEYGRVLIPSFALDRTPYFLSLLYEIYGNDSDFKIPVIIDSPLANDLLDEYQSVIEEDKLEKFNEILSWKNIIRITDAESSKYAIKHYKRAVILSSSGFITFGRSVHWTRAILPEENSCILSAGYASPDSLLYKIKNNRDSGTLMINGTECKNKATVVSLKSFSSHMQRNDLLKYYSSIQADKIYLVHGSKKAKEDFSKSLKEIISEKCKTTKVIIANKDIVGRV